MPTNALAAKHNPYRSRGLCNLATFVIGAEASNVINVAIQLKDANGAAIQERASLYAFLSGDAEGDDLIATGPTSVAVGTNGVAHALIAVKAFRLVTNASGQVDLNITLSSGAATYYLVLVMPDGSLVASSASTFAA